MMPLRANRKPIAREAAEREVQAVLGKILSVMQPQAIYLFGSVALGAMTDQSDIDLLIVMQDAGEAKAAPAKLRPVQPLSSYGVDIVWIDAAEFSRKSQLGGVCMVAATEGRLLFSRAGVNS